jgi:hypothetical protein
MPGLVLTGITDVDDGTGFGTQAVGKDGILVLDPTADRREAVVVAHHRFSRGGVGNVDAVQRIDRESVVDHPVPGLRKGAHMDDHIEHVLVRVVVSRTDEGINFGDIGLGILFDLGRVAVAGGQDLAGRAGEEQRSGQQRENADDLILKYGIHDSFLLVKV